MYAGAAGFLAMTAAVLQHRRIVSRKNRLADAQGLPDSDDSPNAFGPGRNPEPRFGRPSHDGILGLLNDDELEGVPRP